jgi:hypothetical protein
MNRQALKTLLRENGLTYVRDTTHGEFWAIGKELVLVNRAGHFSDRRAEKNLLRDIRRAREAHEARVKEGIKLVGIHDAPLPLELNLKLKGMRAAQEKQQAAIEAAAKESETEEMKTDSIAKLGDVVKSPIKVPDAKPLTTKEAAEYAAAAKRDGKTYQQIAMELHELGYRQADGRPWAASHFNKIVLELDPALRERTRHPSITSGDVRVTVKTEPPVKPLAQPVAPPAPQPPVATSPAPETPVRSGLILTPVEIIRAVKRLEVPVEKAGLKLDILNLLLELL